MAEDLEAQTADAAPPSSEKKKKKKKKTKKGKGMKKGSNGASVDSASVDTVDTASVDFEDIETDNLNVTPILEDENAAREYYKALLEDRLKKAPEKEKEKLNSMWTPHELALIPTWESMRSGCWYPLQWRPLGRFHFTIGEYIIMVSDTRTGLH